MSSDYKIDDIVVVRGKLFQYKGNDEENKIHIIDQLGNREIVSIILVQRKATEEEKRWYLENKSKH